MVFKNLIAGAALSAMLFSSCTENKTTEDAVVWERKGDSLVTKTFDTLRNTLTKAIGEKGLAGAVEFCNTKRWT
jgi:hypothetical protein